MTTDPADVYDLSPMVTGATIMVSHPMKASLPITVRCLCSPSKLQVIDPAPMLTLDPTCASPDVAEVAGLRSLPDTAVLHFNEVPDVDPGFQASAGSDVTEWPDIRH